MKEIKKEFGKYLCFHGGIDIQEVLPREGINKDIEKEHVKAVIDIMAVDRGYILAPTHNIQPDTPPENVIAMYEYAKEH